MEDLNITTTTDMDAVLEETKRLVSQEETLGPEILFQIQESYQIKFKTHSSNFLLVPYQLILPTKSSAKMNALETLRRQLMHLRLVPNSWKVPEMISRHSLQKSTTLAILLTKSRLFEKLLTSSDLLIQLSPRFPPENPTSTCTGSFGSLRSLAADLDELFDSRKLAITFPVRAQLKESAKKTSAVVIFLNQLKSTSAKLTQICTANRQYNVEALGAVGDLMDNLGDLFGTLGGAKDGDKFRNGKEYVNKVLAQVNEIDDLGLGEGDCDRQWDFSDTASTLDDLAALIEEVGLEDLQKQLGVDLSFVSNP